MKKVLLISLTILLVLTGIIGGHFIYNQMTAASYAEADQTDRQMLQKTAEIYQTFKQKSSELWTEDYRLAQLPLIVIRTSKYNDFFCQYAHALNIPVCRIP